MYTAVSCVVLLGTVSSAPAGGFAFPRDDRKLEPIITPPVLPVLEHLERDPSTLLGKDVRNSGSFPKGVRNSGKEVRGQKPRFGFGNSFSVEPSGSGGLTASVSSSASGAGASHSASQSFSFGFNEGFSASHSASQSSSFSGLGSGFSGSQASSQSGSFGGNSASSASSSAAALGGGGLAGSQSASSAFGFNGLGGYNPQPSEISGDGQLDIRHRGGAGAFVFPGPSTRGRGGTVSARSSRQGQRGSDWLAVLVSD